jgi:shikimate kinase
VYALVITGPPGSGKSTTLEALSDLLYDHDVAHACLDVDALSWAHPGLPPDARLRRVAALASLYRGDGYDLLLVAGSIASPTQRDALVDAVDADDCFVVRLDAPLETLRDRIAAREPAGWSQLGALLERASEMRLAMAALNADLVIDTARLRPGTAAAEIRQRCHRIRRATGDRG